MSEREAQVAANPSPSRVAEMARAITRGIKNVAEMTSGPSFAASLASASQTVQGDAPTDGTIAHGGHRAGEAPLAGAEFGPRGRRDHAAGASPTGAFAPASAGLTASQPATSRPPAVTAIRPDGRALGPVPAASSASTPASTPSTASPTAATSTPAVASTPGAASPAPSAPTAPAASSATAQTTTATNAASSSATQQQTAAQPYVAAASAAASQPVSPTVTSPAPGSLTYANVGPPGPSTSVPNARTASPATQPASPAAGSPTYAASTPVNDGQATGPGYSAANSAYAPTSPTTVAPYGSAPAAGQVTQSNPATSTVASAPPTTTTTMPSSGLTADARSAATTAASAPVYAATAPTATATGTTSTTTTATGATTGTSVTAAAAAGQPLALNQYPVPSRNDRSGVLNWASDSPPTGRELDRLIVEARHRKAGWVTFVANPDRLDEYGKLADRLTKAGIQPIARVEDPYGDLPVEDVTALVKELRGHGVRYFQLFDGANVASETPDDRVDVRDYAERWLTTAKAVVAEGGLPGVGALDPDGDYDDLGFLRHVLSAVKERGGADVLGQSWLALRGEQAGATATANTTADLADRASWFDRVSRQALGRSLPILATQDPAGQPERLSADPAATTTSSQVDQSEQSLRRHRRSQPALFAASRGTFAPE